MSERRTTRNIAIAKLYDIKEERIVKKVEPQYETNFIVFKLVRIARHFTTAVLAIIGSAIILALIFAFWLATMGTLSEIFKRELAEDDIGFGNMIAEISYRADLDLVIMAGGFYLVIIVIIASLVHWIPRYARDVQRGRK